MFGEVIEEDARASGGLLTRGGLAPAGHNGESCLRLERDSGRMLGGRQSSRRCTSRAVAPLSRVLSISEQSPGYAPQIARKQKAIRNKMSMMSQGRARPG